MNQPPDDPFYNSPTENNYYSAQQRTNQAPGYPGSAPNYPAQPGYTPQGYRPNQGPMPPQNFAPQNYPPNPNQPGAPQNYLPSQGPTSQPAFAQQRSVPAYAGAQSSQPTSLPPLPEPGNLPRQQTVPGPSRNTSLTRGEYTSNLPEPRPSAASTQTRKLRKGRVFAAIILLLLLVGGGVGAYLSLRHGNTSPTKPVTQTTATVVATATNTSSPATGTIGTVGQPLQAGPNWIVTVTRVRTTTTSDFAPKNGYTYLEISLTLKNSSANPQFVSSLVEFTLTDGSGGQYTESVKDTNIRQAVDGHVALGQTLTGQIAYEVPLSQKNFVLVFQYGLLDGTSDVVTWNLKM